MNRNAIILEKCLTGPFDTLEATSSRHELVALLSEALGAAVDDELQPLIYLCQGRLAPAFMPIEFGMADKTVADASGQAYGAERVATPL